MWDYTDKVLDHFYNPRNYGDMENPDAVGEVGSIACGDALKLMLKIDENKKIVDAKFKTFGCGSAIASSSALTELIKGMTVDEAVSVTNKQIAEYLGGLPEAKMHCSVMGKEALEVAVANYKGESVSHNEEMEGRLICKCFGVTEGKLKKVIEENHLTTVEQVTNYTKAGGACTACITDIEDIIKEVMGELAIKRETSPVKKKKLTNIQRMLLIQETIDRDIKPSLQIDGGDIELIDVDGKDVYVSLRGACTNCPSAGFTLKSFVEAKLREFVGEELNVINESPSEEK
ncbi:MAG: Fe-S cluster assembly protein NifU [Candidatus Eremiobacterota bacterium]